MTDTILRTALVQYAPYWEEKQKNMDRIAELLGGIKLPVDLICFPELSLSGFTMRPELFAEEIEGTTIFFFRKIALTLHSAVCFGLITVDGGKYFNELIILDKLGKIICRYRKLHLFSYAGEDKHYSPGAFPSTVILNDLRIGVSICYDLRFPELYRDYAAQGINVLINIANWPTARIFAWETLLRARAIENQSYVIGVNRVGDDPSSSYNGRSVIIDPMGSTVLAAGEDECIVYANVEKAEVEKIRTRYPFLADMRSWQGGNA